MISRYVLWTPLVLVWIAGSYILGLILGLFLPDFSTSSFLLYFLFITMPGLIIGLLASVPLFVWWKNSDKPWKKRRLLFFVLIILPLLVLYRFSGLINTF